MGTNTQDGQPAARDDDMRAWAVIGSIFFAVSLTVFSLFFWSAAHGSL
jgi:hypothetical protein